MPQLVIFFGLTGSGKSHLAARLSKETGAKHLNTDQVRDALGLRGRYEETVKEKVYAELFSLANHFIQNDQSVILDGTFHIEDRRNRVYELEKKTGVKAIWIEVTCDEAIAMKRVSGKRTYSEADQKVYHKIKMESEPFTEDHLVVDTSSKPVNENIQLIKSYLQ